MYFIFFTGTAGSGKTTMVKEFQDYLLDQELDTAVINLDPAVEKLPYTPDFDVRDYIDAYEVMSKYGLGPNSSLIVSIDLLMSKAVDIKNEISEIEANYVLVDTPGQVELFAYRDTGRILTSLIVGENKAVNVFLLDSFLAKEARTYVSLLLLSSAIRFRMNLPQINILSKVDLLNKKELEQLKKWSNGEELIESLGEIDDYSFNLVNSLIESLDSSPVPVSSISHEGIDEMYAEIQRILAGGEDYLTEENSPRL
ncbi:GTPase [Acidianus sulfidivorans JP7]|uniref:GTPase n=1 Tax=Acidianus sulfidivorans JP7 TaxID=619593 RepID=A0A2U9INR7_9CREN|nr:ATP/GTP-binding protein [Acidianus sulfidivorans]AWR97670.1 GTPase [Acidianus sulfidivorans JP7]